MGKYRNREGDIRREFAMLKENVTWFGRGWADIETERLNSIGKTNSAPLSSVAVGRQSHQGLPTDFGSQEESRKAQDLRAEKLKQLKVEQAMRAMFPQRSGRMAATTYTLEDLELAERYIAEGADRLAKQDRLISDLRMHGHSTTDAEIVAKEVEDSLSLLKSHRHSIVEALHAEGETPLPG